MIYIYIMATISPSPGLAYREAVWWPDRSDRSDRLKWLKMKVKRLVMMSIRGSILVKNERLLENTVNSAWRAQQGCSRSCPTQFTLLNMPEHSGVRASVLVSPTGSFFRFDVWQSLAEGLACGTCSYTKLLHHHHIRISIFTSAVAACCANLQPSVKMQIQV